MTVKLDDDLVGHQLDEQELKRRGDEQFTSFEWQALDLLREIYSAGVRSFIRAVGISDRLLEELIGARSTFEEQSLGGRNNAFHGIPSFEGFFLIGIALGSQVCTDEPDLAAIIESSRSVGVQIDSLEGPFKVGFDDGEISSGLHEGAVTRVRIPLVWADWMFEGFAYDDALWELFKGRLPADPKDVVLVATPPGFTPTGLLDLVRALVGVAGLGFGDFGKRWKWWRPASRTIIAREWLSAGIWLGLWLRARQMQLGVVGDLRKEIESEAGGELPIGEGGSVYQLTCGWEHGQHWETDVLADVRRTRERISLDGTPLEITDQGSLADYVLGRLQVQMSIYSCQATGDFTWWPVYSFVRKGDIVLIRLAPFPKLSRKEIKAWFPDASFEELILEGGAGLLPDEYPPLLGLDRRDWADRDLRVEAEHLWANVPYLRWLLPETPEMGVVNDGLDGLGIVTSDAVWDGGSWRATVGMVRPFIRPVRLAEIAEMMREVRLPLFPEAKDEGSNLDPGSLTMLANLQFLPDRTELDEQELSSILRVASSATSIAGNPLNSAGPEYALEKGGLREPPQALITDFERLKLVRENLRRGWRIEDMGDISPWPVEGTWLREGVEDLFPGRLRLSDRPVLSDYPCWALERAKPGNDLMWRESHSLRWYSSTPEDRFKGDHPAQGARNILKGLAKTLGCANPPLALLLAVPDDGQAVPLEVALETASRSGGTGVPDGGEFLEARNLSKDNDSQQALARAKWKVDPEGMWTRPGSIWRIELRSGENRSGSCDVSIELFVVGTKTVTSAIDIESVSARVARIIKAGAIG